MQNLTIDLQKGFENPAIAKEIVADIQQSIDELTKANRLALQKVVEANKVSDDLLKQVESLSTSNAQFVEAFKNLYRMLNERKDKFKGDIAMDAVLTHMATFVVSGGAIKMGVIAKGAEDEPTE